MEEFQPKCLLGLSQSKPEVAAIIRYLPELGGGSCLGLGQFVPRTGR